VASVQEADVIAPTAAAQEQAAGYLNNPFSKVASPSLFSQPWP